MKDDNHRESLAGVSEVCQGNWIQYDTDLMRDVKERFPAKRSSILLMGVVSNVLPPIKQAQKAGNRCQWAAARSMRSK